VKYFGHICYLFALSSHQLMLMTDIYITFAFVTTDTLDAKWHDNLYNVPFQCVVKVALTVLKSRGNTPQKVLESVENYWRCSVWSVIC